MAAMEDNKDTEIISTAGGLLKHNWVVYYSDDDRDKKWEERMKEIDTITALSDIANISSLYRPSALALNCDYYIFKRSIAPMWEHETNVDGGRWVAYLEPDEEQLDSLWLGLLKAMLNEELGSDDFDREQVCGAVVNARSKGYKISLWTRDAKDDAAAKRIGRAMLEALKPRVRSLKYEVNIVLATKRCSKIKPKWEISDADGEKQEEKQES